MSFPLLRLYVGRELGMYISRSATDIGYYFRFHSFASLRFSFFEDRVEIEYDRFLDQFTLPALYRGDKNALKNG